MEIIEVGFLYDEEEMYHASLWEKGRMSFSEESPNVNLERKMGYYAILAFEEVPALELHITKLQAQILLRKLPQRYKPEFKEIITAKLSRGKLWIPFAELLLPLTYEQYKYVRWNG